MAEARLQIVLDLVDRVSGQLKGVTSELEKHSGQLKKAGAVALGFGAALTAGLTMAVKAAAEEEAGIASLSQALANVGINYDKVKDSLEANIEATQQKTSIADDQQRKALSQLLLITNDYELSLKSMPAAMDLAVATGTDLTTSAMRLGAAFETSSIMIGRSTIKFKEGAAPAEILAEVMGRVGGQAEKMGKTVAGQMKLLQANFGDAAEELGKALLPMVSKLAQSINNLVLWFKKLSPEMQRFIAITTVVTAGVSLFVGGFMLFLGLLPAIIAGAIALGGALHFMLGPIGLITLGIMAAIAAGILLVKNWDTVKKAVLTGVNAMLGGIEWFVNKTIQGFRLLLKPAELYANAYITAFNAVIKGINAMVGYISNKALPAIREIPRVAIPELEVSLGRLEVAAGKVTKEMAGGFGKVRAAIKVSLEEVAKQADKFGEQLVNALKKRNEKMEASELASIQTRLEFEDAALERAKTNLQEGLNVFKDNLAKQNDALRDAFAKKRDEYQRDALARIGALDAQTAEQVAKLQEQIRILESRTDAEREADREREQAQRRQAVVDRLRAAEVARNTEEAKRVTEELAEFDRKSQQEAVQQSRQAQIEQTRNLIEAIRERAAETEASINEEAKRKTEAAETEMGQRIKRNEAGLKGEQEVVARALKMAEDETRGRKAQLGMQLETSKAHYKALNEEEALQAEARKLIIDNNNKEIITLLSTYNPQWQDAGRTFGEKLIQGLESTRVSVQTVVNSILSLVGQAQASAAGLGVTPGGAVGGKITGAPVITTPFGPKAMARPTFTAFQHGGLVMRPTLGLLGEKGPEAVLPLGHGRALAPLIVNVTITNRGVIGVDDLDRHIFEAIRDGKRRGAFQGVIA